MSGQMPDQSSPLKRRAALDDPRPLATLIVALAPSYDTITAAATPTAKNVLPRVPALLHLAQVREISSRCYPKLDVRTYASPDDLPSDCCIGLPPWGDPVGMLVHSRPAGHRWR